MDVCDFEKDAKSRVFLASLTQYERYYLDLAILRYYSIPFEERQPISQDVKDKCFCAYHDLLTCGYMRCGINEKGEKTYKTTKTGLDVLYISGVII